MPKKGNTPWNKGLNKEKDERVLRYGIKGSNTKKGQKLSEEHKRKISKALKGKKPKNLDNIKGWNKGKLHLGGSNHWNWKGGINLENERIRHSLEWQIWRDEVYRRDRWICRLCKKHCQKKEIVAHHIKLFSEFPELRFIVDNGLTLCRGCHIKIHQKGRNQNKEGAQNYGEN